MAICKLCLKDKQLIKKSHIIPNFMYREMLVDNNKIKFFSPSERIQGRGKIRKLHTGEYEGGILCAECDNEHLGDIYENYAARAIYGGKLPENENPICTNYVNENYS